MDDDLGGNQGKGGWTTVQAPQYLVELCQPVAGVASRQVGNIFDPPPNSSWSYRVTSSAPMADGLNSVWLVRRSGISCRKACGIRLLARTVSDNLWRRFCSQRTTDAFSALEVSRRCAIQIDFLLTYLITEACEELNLTIHQASRLAKDRVKWINPVRNKGCLSARTSSSSQRL